MAKLTEKFERIWHEQLPQLVLEFEYRFHPTRKWQFDYAQTDLKIAVEIEGGAFIHGRHTNGIWFVKDCEKYREAAMLGWIVLRYADVKGLDKFPDDYRRAAILAQSRTNGEVPKL